MDRHLTVYTNYYKDEILTEIELPTIQSIKVIDDLIRAGYDILVTHKEHTEDLKIDE